MSSSAQLNNKEIFDPQDTSGLTKKIKRVAINLITIVKEKRNRTVKGRVYADGKSNVNTQQGRMWRLPQYS